MTNKLYEEKISSKELFKGEILSLYFDKVKLPNGKIATREKVSHPGAVGIVPINKKNQVILVKQYRYPISKVLIEIPAGKLDKLETPIECAKRELEEEVGVIGTNFQLLAKIYTSPGFSDELMYIYMITDFIEQGNNPEHDEFLKILKVDLNECLEMIYSGKICDAKSIIGILMAKQKLLNLNSK